ncbi:MAG: KdsC family phosphatase [Gammaproteobacteria bacterium]
MPAWSDELLRRAAAVRLALFDVDGVLTDGRLYYGADGETLKVFDSRDGHGLVLLRRHGIQVGIVSGRNCAAVAARMTDLGVALVYQGCGDKRATLEEIWHRTGCTPAQTAFVGDDLPDLPALRAVGLAIAVADADPGLIGACHLRTTRPGGRGAVREVSELILTAQGHRPMVGEAD